MADKKFQRKVRRLMVQGLSKKEATQRAAEGLVKDFDQMARNTEMILDQISISQKLGQVAVPTN